MGNLEWVLIGGKGERRTEYGERETEVGSRNHNGMASLTSSPVFTDKSSLLQPDSVNQNELEGCM